jgi:hypothetical protein
LLSGVHSKEKPRRQNTVAERNYDPKNIAGAWFCAGNCFFSEQKFLAVF